MAVPTSSQTGLPVTVVVDPAPTGATDSFTLAQAAFDIAVDGTNAAQNALNVATAAAGTTGSAFAQAAFDIAVAGTNAAANALSEAQGAFSIAVSGTNAAASALSEGQTAFSIAVAGTTLAGDAYTIAQAGTNLGQAAFDIAVAGTNAAANARARLSGDRTYYVATSGTNVNSGLLIGSPFQTIQHAVDTVAVLDLGVFNATLQLADGTYSENVVLKTLVGTGKVTINGNQSNPENVVIAGGSGYAVAADASGYILKNFEVRSASSGGLLGRYGSVLTFSTGFRFGTTGGPHMRIVDNASIIHDANYTIAGNATYHISASKGGSFGNVGGGLVVTLVGSPNFSANFALADTCSTIYWIVTFSGTATGSRYLTNLNGVIYTNSAGTAYFPGNGAGSTLLGGQYA